ncbi:MAG: hypothetical protein Greene101449_849, partial [Candidatus Peregrinibacteria bacterium Greene1014_49]
MAKSLREASPEKAVASAIELRDVLNELLEFTVQIDGKNVSVKKHPVPHLDHEGAITTLLQTEVTIGESSEPQEATKQTLRITDTPTTFSESQRGGDRGTGRKRKNGRLTMNTMVDESRTIF